jgi:hypothetical protein
MLTCVVVALVACGAGGGSGIDPLAPNGAKPVVACQAPPAQFDLTRVSGFLSFDRIPIGIEAESAGLVQARLLVNSVVEKPVKGVQVQAVTCSGKVLATTYSDINGYYHFELADVSEIKLRVNAMTNQDSASVLGRQSAWRIRIRDNTRSSQPLYSYETELIRFSEANYERSLHFSSGWQGQSFSSVRQAGPFAILDSLDSAMAKIEQEGLVLDYPSLDIFWSTKNRSVSVNKPSEGELVSSYYSDGAIYLLGHMGTDADDYDEHVILHEWGHFIEDAFSRADSIGGSHSLTSILDPRVSFSEGFGNMWSAVASGDSRYRDVMGEGVSFVGGGFDIEANRIELEGFIAGWFNELSVQSLLFDLYDDQQEEGDEVELPLARWFAVLANEHRETMAFTTIFSFLDGLAQREPVIMDQYQSLFGEQGIDLDIDQWGGFQTNGGGVFSLPDSPLYLPLGSGSVSVCLSQSQGQYNGLGARRFLKLDNQSGGQAIFSIQGAASATRPGIKIWRQGRLQKELTANSANLQSVVSLGRGLYVLELFDRSTLFAGAVGARTSSDQCYSVSVSLL